MQLPGHTAIHPSQLKSVARIFLVLLLMGISLGSFSQNVASYSIDLTAHSDTSITFTTAIRSGDTCSGTNCVVFKVTLNTASDRVNFQASGGPALGAATYKTSCGGTAYNLGTPACLDGSGIVYITFCKNGNNHYDYTISTSSSVKGSDDLTLRQNCSGTMWVTGLQASSVTWTSIYPGSAGSYDNYLSCKSGCASTTVIPGSGAPGYIDYKVSGPTNACSLTRSDTVRIYTSPPLTVAISPNNPAICSGASTTLTATPSGGNAPYTYSWNTAQTISTISTATVGTYTVTVSDNTNGCPAVVQSTNVTAAPTPSAPTVSGVSICAGSTATLTPSAPGGTYHWYDAASGGNLLYTGSSYTTPVLNSTTTYYVETTMSSCPSARTAVTVTVNAVPPAPTAGGATICAGNTSNLTATAPGGTYDWFSSSSGGTSLFTGNSFTTPVLNNSATYYVQSTISGCTGSRTAVNVTVNAIPAAPTATAATICINTSANLQATAPGGTYDWYTVASGGTAIASNTASYTTPVLSSSTTYYVQSTISGCTGSRTAVPVTITNSPAAPTAAGASICAGTGTTLTATAPGGPYEWYNASSGGTLLSSNNSYSTPTLSTNATYWVQAGVAGCLSPRTAVTVTVNAVPPAPTVNGSAVCMGNTANLTATAPGGAYDWFSNSSGGASLFTGNIFTTPVLNSSTTYYVQSTISGCSSNRTAVNVTVNAIPAAPTAAAATICVNTSANLQATAPGGTYDWYTAASGGTAIASNTASYTTPVLSSNTIYYVQSTISGCTGSRTAVSVTIINSPAAPTAAGASICVGTGTTLTATAPGGPYEWYNASSGGTLLSSSASYSTPPLSSNTTYWVQAGVAGCMSPRTAVVVSTNSIPAAPTAAGSTICAGNTTSLTASGSGGIYQWYDAASGGNLLSSNNIYTSPALSGSVNYYVQSVNNGCAGPRTTVAVIVNSIPAAPTASGVTICNNTTATLQATAPGGTYEWFTTASGGSPVGTGNSYTTPALNSNGIYYVQTTASGCTSSRTSVPVTVTPRPSAPTVSSPTICAGNNTTLTATAPGGTYKWYDAASNGNLLTIGDSYTTITLNASTNFYVETSIAGCTGPRSPVTVSVTPLPAAPTAAAAFACEGTTAVLSATAPGGVYQWYDAATGGNLLGGGSTYTTGILSANTMYYVSATVAGCTGSRTTVPVTVTPIPAAPTASGITVCAGNTAHLSASAPGGTYNWYNAISGGSLLSTGAGFATPVLSNTTSYYVETTINGCTSARAEVIADVTPLPAAPTATTAAICAGNATVLTATAPGGIYQWYDAASGGTLLTTAASYATPVLSATVNYYVQAIVSGCAGPRTTVAVTVTPIPSAPVAGSSSICEANIATLTATAPGGNYSWYDAASGGNLLTSGSTFITPVLTTTVKYYVQTSVAGCVGPRTAVTVTVIPKLNPAFQYSSGTFCITGSNPTPTIMGSLTGSFSASSGGLVFMSTSTGQINVAASTPGTYVITFTTGGSCIYSSSSTITITGSPNATFSYNGPFCQLQTAMPNFISGASAGVFSSAQSGLMFVNNSTGEIDLAKSTPGTYNITNNIAASAGCAAATASGSITINAAPTVVAGINQTVCAGTAVQLNGSFGGSASRAQWTGGLGSFSNASSAGSSYTPDKGETIAKLYLTTDDPSGPCNAAMDSLTIFITSLPSAPVVSGNAVCTGTAATLIATSPGGIYEWYDAANSGSLLATSPSFTTPVLNNAATYYVRSTISNCAGPRAPVTVNVNSKPLVTSAGSTAICTGSPLVYDLTSDQPGTSFSWSRSAVAGVSNSATSGLTNGRITEVLNNTGASPVNVTYTIIPNNNNCTGDPFAFVAVINPVPATPSVSSSTPICVGSTLSLFTSAVTGATYNWSGPANFSSALQNPMLPNITLGSAGIYSVTVTVNGCTSQAGSKNVFPVIAAPAAKSNAPLCSGSTLALTAGNLTGAAYSWIGPNGFNSTLQNPLIAGATSLMAGTYYLTASIAGCPGLTDSVKVLVNIPPTTPQISSNSPICSRDSVTLNATSVNGATYQWTGPNGFSSTQQSPVIRNAATQASGTYTVIASTTGCTITSNASLSVTVKITPNAPATGSNSPVCMGSSLNLFASGVSGANYQWLTVAGVVATTQNPIITPATTDAAGTYYVVASLNGCVGDTGMVKVAVVTPAITSAGTNQEVCANNATVQLNGLLSGEDTKTASWKTDGSGSFFPNETTLTARYIPATADTARGAVNLTLSSTNNKVCPASNSSLLVTIAKAPVTYAGRDTAVCSNDSLISLQGKVINAGGGQWYSLGSGTFRRSGNGDLNPVFIPSRQDILSGKVLLYLASTNNGSCRTVYDTVQANIVAAPRVNLGADRLAFQDDKVSFNPIITGNNYRYQWTPNIDLSDNTIKNTVMTAKNNITYRLTVFGDSSCSSYDEIFIKVLKPIAIPNVFSPNGDGIHDTWEMPELNNYPGATVEIFTRSGMKIYSSVGYEKPWDGTYNGKPAPVATYYYIINTHYNNIVFSGSVTVLR